jgi:hypothetical protein
MAHLDTVPAYRLGPQAPHPPSDLGIPGASGASTSSIPRDQGADEARTLDASISRRASRQGGRSTMVPCHPVAGTAGMSMVAGNQGSHIASGAHRPLRLGPNIMGRPVDRGPCDMLPDDFPMIPGRCLSHDNLVYWYDRYPGTLRIRADQPRRAEGRAVRPQGDRWPRAGQGGATDARDHSPGTPPSRDGTPPRHASAKPAGSARGPHRDAPPECSRKKNLDQTVDTSDSKFA